jgi:glycerol uptake facilitator-like aquaporin
MPGVGTAEEARELDAAARGERMTLARRTASEAVGTALLLAAVVGSGIMGERLAGGNAAIALLANTLATGAALVALILTFGPISGAHFNPAVTLTHAVRARISWRDSFAYLAAQILGAFAGVVCAHLMFSEPPLSASTHARSGIPQAFSELVATFGLVSVIFGCSRRQPSAVALAVGAYIAAAYWFTASTSFANPAVTMARAATDTFSGIRPADVPAFLAAQLGGAALAAGFFAWLDRGAAEAGSAIRGDARCRPFAADG